MESKRSVTTHLTNVIAYALIGAIAFIVMKFEFPIMPGVGFLKFDFSDVIITIGMFVFGPLPGIVIALIRMILALLLGGFAFPSVVGQLAAFVASIAFALPFYYTAKGVEAKQPRTVKRYLLPVLGLLAGILAMTVILAITNAFILTPVYALTAITQTPTISSYGELLALTEHTYLQGMLHLPSMASYIFSIIVPFNLIKGAINAVAFYLLFEAVLKNIKPFVRKRFNLN